MPRDEDGLRRTFRYVHRHYTGYINARMRVTGHLWQGRFSSVAMDEAHLVCALRYVAFNPVRARLVERALRRASQGGERRSPRRNSRVARRHGSADRAHSRPAQARTQAEGHD